MSNSKPKLKIIEGSRDNLENQIAHALFTEFDQNALKQKVENINQWLAPKGKLSPVDTSQTPQDEH